MIIEINRGTWEAISCSVEREPSLSLVIQNVDEPRYAPDTLDFTVIKPTNDLIDYLVTTHTKTPIRAFSDDLTFLFEGDIDTGSSLTLAAKNQRNLSLTATDICGRLDIPTPEKGWPDPEDGWPEIGTDLQTIAQRICNYAGVPHNFPIEMSQIMIDYFVVDGYDNRQNCLEVLDNLFFERGYVLSARYDNGIAEVGAYDWWHRGFTKGDPVYPDLDCSKYHIPFEINPRRIDYDVLNVEWTRAGHFDRGHTGDSDGLLLYHLGTDSKVPIIAEHYYPERGNIEKVWQSYNSDFIKNRSDTKKSDYSRKDLNLGPDARVEDTRIIYAWDQYVQYKAQAVSITIPGGDSRPEVIVSGSPDIGQPLIIFVEVHRPQRSQVVFYNRTKDVAGLVQGIIDTYRGDSLNLDFDISKGWTMELRDFIIAGNAIYSQGEGNASVGIFSNGEEQIVDSVVKGRTQAEIKIKGGSTVQNHYKGFRVTSENGTNAIVASYNGASKTLIINDFNTVSDFDVEGTRINLISPTEGAREETVSTEYTFSQNDANRLAEGLKNDAVWGRFSYEYDSTLNHPKIGSYVVLDYSEYDITDRIPCQVVGYEWSPDSKQNHLARIQLKRVNEFNPNTGFESKLIDYPPIGQPPTTAGGWEIIRATTPTKNLLPGQLPDSRWGYRTPGTRGGVSWDNFP